MFWPQIFWGRPPPTPNFWAWIIKFRQFPIMWRSFAAIGRGTLENAWWKEKTSRAKQMTSRTTVPGGLKRRVPVVLCVLGACETGNEKGVGVWHAISGIVDNIDRSFLYSFYLICLTVQVLIRSTNSVNCNERCFCTDCSCLNKKLVISNSLLITFTQRYKPSSRLHWSSYHNRLVQDVVMCRGTQCTHRLNVHRTCRYQNTRLQSVVSNFLV